MLTPPECIRKSVVDSLESEVTQYKLVSRDEFTMTYELVLTDDRQVILRLPCSTGHASIVAAEVNTLRYIASHTQIPVVEVLAFNGGSDDESTSSCFAVLQKPPGICVETVFKKMSAFDQNLLIATVARWMVEVSKQPFDSIGSLAVATAQNDFVVGPVVAKPFYTDGRSNVVLDRGPFKSAKAYYRACAQREQDALRMLFVQDAPPYRQDLEESHLTVERIAGLFCDLINRCQGLDEDDPEKAPFSLDIHELGLKNVFVSPENPTRVSRIGKDPHDEAARLAAIFKAEVSRVAGKGSAFERALELDDAARNTLDDLSTYDAFRDGFLLLPALENILATLPGHEDVAGLTAILDPSTLPGRAARINLLTRGSNVLYLAMTPPRSPRPAPVRPDDVDQASADRGQGTLPVS
ncbi:uncharacterized protein BXZ73DRAFT_96148 [Epithele typhae]|uniref:uncharacterized protein n=1 Tax=Epithele typhae TaxID=378194 RepID=UPI0020086A76|nr:uncharacterized protein BXZ73DRAFT_96148 [Epithele typhae]KAH9945158.1 hypothetical protein BXZ73DRAFT_96148 [Epithele typhae]